MDDEMRDRAARAAFGAVGSATKQRVQDAVAAFYRAVAPEAGTGGRLMITVGTKLYGYCRGSFDRDSYQDKRVEAIGADWCVAREIDSGRVVFTTGDVQEFLLEFTIEQPEY